MLTFVPNGLAQGFFFTFIFFKSPTSELILILFATVFMVFFNDRFLILM